jgi:hypothetical protein
MEPPPFPVESARPVVIVTPERQVPIRNPAIRKSATIATSHPHRRAASDISECLRFLLPDSHSEIKAFRWYVEHGGGHVARHWFDLLERSCLRERDGLKAESRYAVNFHVPERSVRSGARHEFRSVSGLD